MPDQNDGPKQGPELALPAEDRFASVADLYDRYRPGYPPALIDWLIATAGVRPGARVADIGCGTGIVTRLLAARGLDVVGIDPNEDMLSRARRHSGGRFVHGDAHATGLGDGSVDLVTAGQAFHWFNIPKAMAELRRILARGPQRPQGGFCAAFWNLRGSSAFADAYEALLQRIEDYRAVPRFEATMAAIEASPGVANLQAATFPYEEQLDEAAFLGRVASSSYVAHGVRERADFDAAVKGLFQRFARAGRVTMPYRAVARMWQLP